ncbi:hypothetical protein CBL_21059 [Carabus blaptoides fortunei]
MKFVLILVIVSIVAAQIVYAQDGSKGKSTEHKPKHPGKSAEHKPHKAGGAAAIHRFRRSPMPQGAQASGSAQVSAGGQPGANLGQMADKARQMVGKAKQMAGQMVNKAKQMGEQMRNRHQMGGHGQVSGQAGVNGQAGTAS